jgi:hypothetical protein
MLMVSMLFLFSLHAVAGLHYFCYHPCCIPAVACVPVDVGGNVIAVLLAVACFLASMLRLASLLLLVSLLNHAEHALMLAHAQHV